MRNSVRNWFGCCCLFLLATPAWAQQDYRVEIEGFGGFTWSDGVPIRPQTIGNETIDEVAPKSGGSYGLGVGVFLSEYVELGFQFTQQFSVLEATVNGPVVSSLATTTRDVADMKVNNYHGVFIFNYGFEDSTIRPFFFGGLGATQYDPEELTVQTLGSQPIEGTTRFSATWGGGVKFYPGSNVGITVTGRWTPTRINASPRGIWCSPSWVGGCVRLANPNYSHQFQLASGVSLRF